MEGRSRHCPHLGLKHTRSIRFSSPTPEHRCYIFGDPMDINVDQRIFCLSERHVECPRFAGQEAPPVAVVAPTAKPNRRASPRTPSATRARNESFFQRIPRRERILYFSLGGLLLFILAIYGIVIGVIIPAQKGRAPTQGPVALVTQPPTGAPTTAQGAVPTSGEAKTTQTAPVVVVPTRVATFTPLPTQPGSATARPTIGPVSPTQGQATAAPTDAPRPTVTPVVVPTARPTVPPTTAAPAPTNPPAPEYTWSKLYFLGPNKAYYVPVWRRGPYTLAVARRVMDDLVSGPEGGSNLLRTLPQGMGVLGLDLQGGTLSVNLDHNFQDLGAGRVEAMGVVLALTEFSTVQQVQFLVNGAPVGLPGDGGTGPVSRPTYANYEDPYGIGGGSGVNLTLYFATSDGQHLFPIVRRIAYTEGVAKAAIEEMIKGPSSNFRNTSISLLPADTAIKSITRDGNTIVVDFNSAFLNAPNHYLAVQALVQAVTDLTADNNLGVDSIRITVEGADLGSYWGSGFSGNVYPDWLNGEYP